MIQKLLAIVLLAYCFNLNAQKPELVKDINVKPIGKHGTHFTVLNKRIFFLYRESSTAPKIIEYKNQGYNVIVDFDSISNFNSGNLEVNFTMVATDEKLFFSFYKQTLKDGYHKELWVSDGSTSGTHVLINNIDSSKISITNLEVINDRLFFLAKRKKIDKKNSLWTSDGTKQGTIEVAGTFDNLPNELTLLPFKLGKSTYLHHRNTRKIWKINKKFTQATKVDYFLTDGFNYSAKVLSYKDGVVFNIKEKADSTCAVNCKTINTIWYSVGKKETNQILTKAPHGFSYMHPLDDGFIFWGTFKNSYPLIYYDFKNGEISKVEIPRNSKSDWVIANRKFYFTKTKYRDPNEYLYRFSPKEKETVLIDSLPFSIRHMLNTGNEILLEYYNPNEHEFLARYNPESKKRSKIQPFSRSSKGAFPNYFSGNGRHLYFITSYFDGKRSNKIFRTDGTETGTSVFLDSGEFRNLKTFNNALIFDKKEGSFYSTYIAKAPNSYEHLVTIDSSSIWASPDNWCKGKNFMFFTAMDPQQGYTLWKTDGTANRTSILTDFSFANWGVKKDESFLCSGDSLYFSARENKNAVVLLGVDGESEEFWNRTLEVDDWRSIHSMAAFKNDVYFILGLSGKPTVYKICNKCKNKHRPVKWAEPHLKITNLVVADSIIYFIKINEQNAWELWKTDGTLEGNTYVKQLTKEVKEITSDNLVILGNMLTSNGNLFFEMHQRHQSTLWFTGGSSVTTRPLFRYNEDDNESIGSNLKAISANGKLYYYFTTPEYGREIWVSDGTIQGTKMLYDIKTGKNGSNPRVKIEMVGNNLLFSADDGINGQELWKIPLSIEN